MTAKAKHQQNIAQDQELEQLKRLLFDTELQSVETLRKHLLDPQQRITDNAEILAESINIAAEKQNLVAALSSPVNQCIQTIVAEKPQQFADSLFPVMGPAIRKSISETLKSFVQSTNQMIEQSMSLKSLRWRWEAKRSGVPFSEIVLKHSLLYRVEEIFLIQQGSGLLIEHVSHPDVITHDSDAISAMLTVIRDFSRDSFATEANDSLQTVEFGDQTLWIFDGPKALLACVNRGIVPKTNRTDLQSVLEQFHTNYGPEIAQYAGERSQNPEFHELLETCLTQQSKKLNNGQENQPQKRHWLLNPLVWILLLAGLLVAYWQWIAYDERRRTDALLTELKDMDGVVVIASEEKADTLLIKGLKDPLVPDLGPVAKKHGFTKEQLQFTMSLYQSLDASLAVQRAANFLDIPNTVTLTVKNQQLIPSGKASRQWLDFADKLRNRIPGFSVVNFDRVEVDNSSWLLQLRKILKTPQSVQLRLDKDTLFVTGTAPAAWIKDLQQNSVLLPSKLNLRTHDQGKKLVAQEWLQAVALQKELDGIAFYFSEGTTFNPKQQNLLHAHLNKVKQLHKLLRLLQADVRYAIKGYADGSGNSLFNQSLKLQRAEKIKQRLLQFGINPALVSVSTGHEVTDSLIDTALRRVDMQVSLLKPKLPK
ncbi:MAG: hypothetical protein V3U75_09025 [Methylococcaceae bacterium]